MELACPRIAQATARPLRALVHSSIRFLPVRLILRQQQRHDSLRLHVNKGTTMRRCFSVWCVPPETSVRLPRRFLWFVAVSFLCPLRRLDAFSFNMWNKSHRVLRLSSAPIRVSRRRNALVRSSERNFEEEGYSRAVVEPLLSSALARAVQTLSQQGGPTPVDDAPPAPQEEPPQTRPRSQQFPTTTAVLDEILPRPSNTNELYGKHPCVTMTALAHSQWSYVLRPGIDSAIDATCGNGGDSLVLAKLLFEPRSTVAADSSSSSGGTPGQSNLICVDVDPQACHNTRQRLLPHFPKLLQDDSIRILQRSHDPLPLPKDASSIGLVTYNLGYLPHQHVKNKQSTSSEQLLPLVTITTQTSSTLSSLTQAVQALRVGGMLSVITYPATNPPEDQVVRAFVTGLALFSSRTTNWTKHRYIQEDFDKAVEVEVEGVNWNERVLECLHQVYESALYSTTGTPTWRVHEHRKLGWTDAPALLTAIRLK